MFVGDVRWATTRLRVFLQVVGRQEVIFGPRELREELPRLARDQAQSRRLPPASERCTSRSCTGWLARHAKSGAANQSARNGAATISADGCASISAKSAQRRSAAPAYMLRTKLAERHRALACTCAAEFHSSSRWRTNRRPSVRTTASIISTRVARQHRRAGTACGRSRRARRHAACAASCRDRCWAVARADRPAQGASAAGTPAGEHAETLTAGAFDDPATRKAAGRGSATRACGGGCRASSIERRASSSRLRRRMIHGSNCQSPRAHRWLRAAATSVCAGNSSNSSMSLTNPQRA